MARAAFVVPLTAARCFSPCSYTPLTQPPAPRWSRRPALPVVTTKCCSNSDAQQPQRREPMEDGVTLPQVGRQTLSDQAEWLRQQLTSWLNAEWRQAEPQAIHDQIGKRAAQVYLRQRLEGEHDLINVMLAIGGELEGMDLSSAFVGPWNVANTAAELMLQHCAGERLQVSNAVQGPGAVTWASYQAKAREKQEEELVESAGNMATAPSLLDRFEKMKFLKDVLDGSASKQMVDGAVAAAVGFRFDRQSGAWDGGNVNDAHFSKFGDEPPDILGDEQSGEMSDTLLYLEGQLVGEQDDGEQMKESLDIIVETLHGAEMTKIQSDDASDHSFRKRVIVAKWLHVRGGF